MSRHGGAVRILPQELLEFKNLLSFASHKSRVNRWLVLQDQLSIEDRTKEENGKENEFINDAKTKKEKKKDKKIILCYRLGGEERRLMHLVPAPAVSQSRAWRLHPKTKKARKGNVGTSVEWRLNSENDSRLHGQPSFASDKKALAWRSDR